MEGWTIPVSIAAIGCLIGLLQWIRPLDEKAHRRVEKLHVFLESANLESIRHGWVSYIDFSEKDRMGAEDLRHSGLVHGSHIRAMEEQTNKLKVLVAGQSRRKGIRRKTQRFLADWLWYAKHQPKFNHWLRDQLESVDGTAPQDEFLNLANEYRDSLGELEPHKNPFETAKDLVKQYDTLKRSCFNFID